MPLLINKTLQYKVEIQHNYKIGGVDRWACSHGCTNTPASRQIQFCYNYVVVGIATYVVASLVISNPFAIIHHGTA